MFSMKESKPVTPYEGSAYFRLYLRAVDYAGGAFFLFIFAQGFLTNYIENTYGVDVYGMLAFGSGAFYYLIPVVLVFGLAYLVSRAVYSQNLQRLLKRFVRSFAENPACYNCGYHIPGIFRDQETGDPDDLVVTCPECGAACPVVCMKDGKLVPVRARRAGA